MNPLTKIFGTANERALKVNTKGRADHIRKVKIRGRVGHVREAEIKGRVGKVISRELRRKRYGNKGKDKN